MPFKYFIKKGTNNHHYKKLETKAFLQFALPFRSNLHSLLLRDPFLVFPPNKRSPPGIFTIACPSRAPGDPDLDLFLEFWDFINSEEVLKFLELSAIVMTLKKYSTFKKIFLEGGKRQN